MKLVSIKLYLEFLNTLFTCTHPIIFLLALISFRRNWIKFLTNPAGSLTIVFMVVSAGVILLKLLSQGWTSDRYFLPLSFFFCLFAADGIHKLSIYLNKKIKIIPHNKQYKSKLLSLYSFQQKIGYRIWSTIYKKLKFNYKKLKLTLIIITLVIIIGKSLIPHNSKPWFYYMRDNIHRLNTTHLQSIIISNEDDNRIMYYSKSEYYLLNLKNFSFNDDVMRGVSLYSNLPELSNYKFDSKNFYSNLNKLGGENLFLFIYGFNDEEFQNLLKKQNLQFKFNLIKSFVGKRNTPACLYQYMPSG